MNFPPVVSMDFPPELLEKYTAQQLADALAARIIADVHLLTNEVKVTDAQLKELEALDGLTPYPRLAAGFDVEAAQMTQSIADAIKAGRLYLAAVQESNARASALRARFNGYLQEIRSVLGTVERSPRG